MFLTLTMTMRSAAFFDIEGDLDGTEVARILHRLADDLDATSITGGEAGTLHDFNGHTVGSWRIAPLRDGAL
jgi:hypothetical protein